MHSLTVVYFMARTSYSIIGSHYHLDLGMISLAVVIHVTHNMMIIRAGVDVVIVVFYFSSVINVLNRTRIPSIVAHVVVDNHSVSSL